MDVQLTVGKAQLRSRYGSAGGGEQGSTTRRGKWGGSGGIVEERVSSSSSSSSEKGKQVLQTETFLPLPVVLHFASDECAERSVVDGEQRDDDAEDTDNVQRTC